MALENFSQGGAYVNNLFLGSIRLEPVPDRPTPYHLPHSTKMAGYIGIFCGDDRVIGNIFAGDHTSQPYADNVPAAAVVGFGTEIYEGAPASFEEYLEEVGKRWGDQQRFVEVLQPVTIAHNLYLPGNTPWSRETTAQTLSEGQIGLVTNADGSVDLDFSLPAPAADAMHEVVRGSQLGRVRVADTAFESPDGSDVVLDTDLLGARVPAGETHAVGPFATLEVGQHRVRVWPLTATT